MDFYFSLLVSVSSFILYLRSPKTCVCTSVFGWLYCAMSVNLIRTIIRRKRKTEADQNKSQRFFDFNSNKSVAYAAYFSSIFGIYDFTSTTFTRIWAWINLNEQKNCFSFFNFVLCYTLMQWCLLTHMHLSWFLSFYFICYF